MEVPILAVLIICVFATNVVHRVDPLVSINQGLVRGLRSSDGTYSMFLGIPFARVDAENPFGDALPGPVFDQIYDAYDDSAACPQYFDNTLEGSLDCLHINVFVPSSASLTDPRPVMVWIYGGGFSNGRFGQSDFGPQYIIRHDVVLVTLNYRVGPYGFMCLDIPSVPGNAGLKDQQAGLRWVKENIASFGGNTNSITVFGESAGAMSINFQILASSSNGLFHRAIQQSGTALVEQLVVHSRPSAPSEMAQYLGFDAETMEEALEIIKSVPTNDLVRAGQDLGIVFKPCVEKSFDGVNNIIIDYPDNVLESGKYNTVPLLVGYNSHEQLGRYVQNINNQNYYEEIQNFIFERLNASFAFKSESIAEEAAKIVQQFYIGTKTVSKDVAIELSAFDSDVHFDHPIDRLVKYTLRKSVHPVYQYLFAYSGEVNFAKRKDNITVGGAVHADDLGYLFTQADSPDENNPEDQLVIDRMTKMWTNFAKYGDPTPEVSDLLPIRWPAVSRDLREYLYIDSELAVDRKPLHDRIAFWDLFFLAYGKYLRMVW